MLNFQIVVELAEEIFELHEKHLLVTFLTRRDRVNVCMRAYLVAMTIYF